MTCLQKPQKKELPPLDIEAGLRRLGPTPHEYIEAVQSFIVTIQESLLACHRALKRDDFTEVLQHAQYIRTLARTISAYRLTTISRQVERALRCKSYVEAHIFLYDLCRAFEDLKNAFETLTQNHYEHESITR